MIRAISIGAVVAAVLDALFAVVAYVFVLRAYSVVGVLQWIASGPLGDAAFQGGLATAALGVAIHFALAFGFAGLYYALSRRFTSLASRPVPWGLAYGAGIWLFMSLLVVPNSGVPKTPFNPALWFSFLVDHAAFVGLPIALAIKRYAK